MSASEFQRELDEAEEALRQLPLEASEAIRKANEKLLAAYLVLLEENAILRGESCPKCRRLWRAINTPSES